MHSSSQRPLSKPLSSRHRQCVRRLVPGRMRAATTERRHPGAVFAAPPHLLLAPYLIVRLPYTYAHLLSDTPPASHHQTSTRTAAPHSLVRDLLRHPRPHARVPHRPPQLHPSPGARLGCIECERGLVCRCAVCVTDGWQLGCGAGSAAHAAAPARGGAHACAAVAATRSGAACSTCPAMMPPQNSHATPPPSLHTTTTHRHAQQASAPWP